MASPAEMIPGVVNNKEVEPPLQAQLEKILHKVDICLSEILNVKAIAGKSPENSPCGKETKKKGKVSWSADPSSLRQTAIHEEPQDVSRQSEWPKAPKATVVARQSEWPDQPPRPTESPPAMGEEVEDDEKPEPNIVKAPRAAIVAGGVDLQVAWRLHAKRLTQQATDLEIEPMLRLVHRTRLEQVWEFLDDQDSSRGAWWACLLMKLVVISSMFISILQNTSEPIMDPVAAAVWETLLDSLFLVELLARVVSTPLKRLYFKDPLNWADMLSVLALPLRVATGFVVETTATTPFEHAVDTMLLFVVPILRFLKLLRYFEIFRLLIDAFRNSCESLPVLAYLMSVIVVIGATGIYLFEDRANIPSLQHSMWLAIVTMTSVGYGDYFPESIGGYVVVSVLTFVSVLFLALPVGIIGYEFTSSWQSRHRVLLVTKARKCLEKWGYSAKDVRVLFDYVDVNGDGNLNLSEFIELIRQMRIGINVETAFNIFTLFDDDQSGTVDSSEFLRHIFPEEYVKDQQEKQMPPRKSKAVAGEALQHLRGSFAMGEDH